MSRSRLGAGCWNGANRSPPGQPPPPPYPPPRCGNPCGGRGGPPKEGKLKNCADAGPAIPTSSATATANAISGPLSVKTRKKDFGTGMRFDRHGGSGNRYSSGIGPQAGRFCAIGRASAAAVKGAAVLSFSRLLLALAAVFQRPRNRSSTSEEANPSAAAPIAAWKLRRGGQVGATGAPPRSGSAKWPIASAYASAGLYFMIARKFCNIRKPGPSAPAG